MHACFVWFFLALCNNRRTVMGCVVIGRWVALAHTALGSLPTPHALRTGHFLFVRSSFWYVKRPINLGAARKCQSKFMPLMFISCLSVRPCERGWVCVLMMCECACKYRRKKKERDESHSESLHPFHFAAEVIHLSELNCYQFMIALWLPVFYPPIPTHKPGGGLVNGEGDGEGDQTVPLFRYWVGSALKWKSWGHSLSLVLFF